MPEPAGLPFLALHLEGVGDVWEARWNGVRIGGHGRIEDGRIVHHGMARQLVLPLPAVLLRKGPNQLEIVARGESTYGRTGLHYPNGYFLAEYASLVSNNALRIRLVLVGLYLFFGIYHLLLFVKRPQERYNAYFAAFCCLLSVYLFSRTPVAYNLVSNRAWLIYVELLALCPLPALMLLFLRSLFYGSLNRVTGALAAACVSPFLAFPFGISAADGAVKVFQVAQLLCIPYIVFLVVRAVFRRIPTAKRILVGALMLAATVILDILKSRFSFDLPIDDLMQYGFFGFVGGVALILSNRFAELHSRVEAANADLEEKVRLRTTELQQTLDVMNLELDLAQSIQEGIIARGGNPWYDIQYDVLYRPLHKVSGDYVDVFRTPEHAHFLVLDVSGHGVPAALITMSAKQLFIQAIQEELLTDPAEIFVFVNKKLAERIKTRDYATACLLRLDRDYTLHCCGAGHGYPLLLRKETGLVEELQYKGFFLGMFAEAEEFVPCVTRLGPGDRLFLFTDGIPEQRNSSGEIFGDERMTAIIRNTMSQPLSSVGPGLVEAVVAHAGGSPIRDDMSMLSLELRGSSFNVVAPDSGVIYDSSSARSGAGAQ